MSSVTDFLTQGTAPWWISLVALGIGSCGTYRINLSGQRLRHRNQLESRSYDKMIDAVSDIGSQVDEYRRLYTEIWFDMARVRDATSPNSFVSRDDATRHEAEVNRKLPELLAGMATVSRKNQELRAVAPKPIQETAKELADAIKNTIPNGRDDDLARMSIATTETVDQLFEVFQNHLPVHRRFHLRLPRFRQ